MIKDARSYSTFLYTLEKQFPEIKGSKIHFFNTSASKAIAYGRLHFDGDVELRFREVIDFSVQQIIEYGYKVTQNQQTLYYYDSQPHPNDPDLVLSFPHHKHIPPNIKHNRKPAPNISFERPNLPILIQEIIDHLL